MDRNGLGSRHTIGRHLHDVGGLIVHGEDLGEKEGRQHPDQDPQEVNGEECHPGMPGEKRPHQQEIDREPCATAHEGRHQDRDQARLLALNRSCSHNRRDTAPKAHKHRHKALAVQPYRRHEAIHDKGGPR